MPLVALLELAPSDPQVAELAGDLTRQNRITEEQLGSRLLARAGLRNDRRSI